MKKNLFVGTLVLMALVNCPPAALARIIAAPGVLVLSATIDVPVAAKATVARLFPGVKGVTWEKEDGNYEAGLKHNGRHLSLVIDANGNVLETETTITQSALPAPVRDYVARYHAGKKIREAAEIVDAGGRKTYEAEVGSKDLIFDEKGRFIR